MAARSPYVEQLETSARLIAEKLGRHDWRSLIKAAAANRPIPGSNPTSARRFASSPQMATAEIMVAPIGFVCDHVEVLYDLDIEAKQIADSFGCAADPR